MASLAHAVRIRGPIFHPYSFYPIPFIMPGSRLKKRPSIDPPVSSQSKPMHSPSSPEPKLRIPREPYPMPSSNPASQYTLMEKLGTGSFGTVYKAMHNETKQIVAVKQIGASFAPPLASSVHPSLTAPLIPDGSSTLFDAQISKIRTMTFLKYNRKSPTWLSTSQVSSLVIMAPLSSTTSSGSSWSI